MLQFVLKNFIKIKSPPYFTVDKVEQPPNQNIGYGHQIDNAIVHPFSLAIIRFTLQCRPAHGTLGLSESWEYQTRNQ